MSESELREEISQLRAEIDRMNNRSNGILLVLSELLPPLLKKNPEIAAQLEYLWRNAADEFDSLAPPGTQLVELDATEPLETLEVQKILYQNLGLLGVWSKPNLE